MHVQIGFDLNHVKHYGSPESAQVWVENALKPYIDQGVVFNILVVSQRRGGPKSNAEDMRYIPLITCIRVDDKRIPFSAQQCAINFGRLGFVAFA